MPPITKFWHSTLKDGKSTNTPDFTQVLSEILELCSSYTNPDPVSQQMHALYQDVNDPTQLLMITGYPSEELNAEADKVYAEKYLSRLFEHVHHVWLKQLDIDVRTLPLNDKLVVTCGKSPSDWKNSRCPGGWDVWKKTRQALDNDNEAKGVETLDNPDDGVWVQVSGWGEDAQHIATPEDGNVFYLQKVRGH
ncbi:hypothetical protein N7474_004563 [Penicillium riverlandense]|uniref:uncharacterized protein n=1 Tax=Penicillium riverlandense TaxID=1903569 RepID=UPI002547E59A|nr:uncharacterized protein N7474_004563 [Penicillium riverlandense]KAJ5818972.1 hypothetical protein N7474_004563 [Penicillium riverlandense]